MLGLILTALSAVQGPAELKSVLNSAAEKLNKEKDIEVGIRVESLGGEVVYDYQGEDPFVLASNVKVLTTAAALLQLGPDFRWHTELWLDGTTLWVVGSGDPSLRRLPAGDASEVFLDQVVESLKENRISSLSSVVLDARCIASPPRNPLWPEDQWQETYCAPVAALAVEGGCLEITASGGGVRVAPALNPPIAVDFRHTGKGKPVSAWWASRGLVVRGDMYSGESIRLAVRDPVETFGRWFKAGLQSRGVLCERVAVAESEESVPGSRILNYQSAWTLADAVALANLESDNFTAELILLALGNSPERSSTTQIGARKVLENLEPLGVNSARIKQADGSGLARSDIEQTNLAAPADLCAVLRGMAERVEGRGFFRSLPIGGVQGRLARRFQGPIFQPQRVRAKTGWISGASSLSGYLLTIQDEVIVFSIVVNYVRDGTARTHNKRFRDFQESILGSVLALRG